MKSSKNPFRRNKDFADSKKHIFYILFSLFFILSIFSVSLASVYFTAEYLYTSCSQIASDQDFEIVQIEKCPDCLRRYREIECRHKLDWGRFKVNISGSGYRTASVAVK